MPRAQGDPLGFFVFYSLNIQKLLEIIQFFMCSTSSDKKNTENIGKTSKLARYFYTDLENGGNHWKLCKCFSLAEW